MSSLPRVSVAIASYNYGRYLGETIESALGQTGVDLEVVVVDDASSDDSVAVASAIAASDHRVRVIEHADNHGHIATFNEALWAATGDYVVKLDSDDQLTPGALSRASAVLDAHPEVVLVYGNPLTFEDQVPPARTRVSGVQVWSGRSWLTTRCRKATNAIMQPEAMVRTAALHLTDGHRANVPAAHDLNLWLRLAMLGDVARIRGVDQGYYRVHQQSLLHSRFGGYLSDLQQRRLAFDDFYDTLDPDSGIDAATFRARTHRVLARQALRHAARQLDRGAAGEPPEPYLEFALATAPACGDSRLWRGISIAADRRSERHASADGRTPWSWWREQGRYVEDSLRWRWWRRYGT